MAFQSNTRFVSTVTVFFILDFVTDRNILLASSSPGANGQLYSSDQRASLVEFTQWIHGWDHTNQNGWAEGFLPMLQFENTRIYLSFPCTDNCLRETALRFFAQHQPALERFLRRLTVQSLLAFYLLYHRSLGEKSELFPWIAVFPSGPLPGAMFWTGHQLAELEAVSPSNEYLRVRLLMDEEYQDFRSVLSRQFPPDMLDKWFDLDSYIWAREKVLTRSWHLELRKYAFATSTAVAGTIQTFIVPIADFVNSNPSPEDLAINWTTHSRPNTELFALYGKFHRIETRSGADVADVLTRYLRRKPDDAGGRDAENGHLESLKNEYSEDVFAAAYADRDYEANEQIFESHPGSTNDIFLFKDGFVPDVNPYECFQVTKSSFNESAAKDGADQGDLGHRKAQRRRLLTKVGLHDPTMTPTFGSTNSLRPLLCLHYGELSDKMLAYFSVGLMQDAELDLCRSVSNASGLVHCAGHFHTIRTLSAAQAWLQNQLQSFNTSSRHFPIDAG